MATVLLADDHAIARACVAGLVRADASLTLVAQTDDGFDAWQLIERLKPDLVIASVTLPRISGLSLVRRVRTQFPRTRVVLQGAPAIESYLIEAARLGAAAYLTRDADSQELTRAVQEALQGRGYVSEAVWRRDLNEMFVTAAKEPPSDPLDDVTQREREVLRLAAEGLTNAKIAGRLGISRRTAESHRASALSKLGIRSHSELVLYAIRRGILPFEWEDRPREPRARRP